jgi:hypothetical protein
MKDGSGKKHSRCRARKLRAAKYEAWMEKRPPQRKKRVARPRPDTERTLADTVQRNPIPNQN